MEDSKPKPYADWAECFDCECSYRDHSEPNGSCTGQKYRSAERCECKVFVPFPEDRLKALEPRTFELTSLSRVKAEKWLNAHAPTCPEHQAMSERIEQKGMLAWGFTWYSMVRYEFYETGVGDGTVVVCLCGKKKDISDSTGW